MGRRGEYSHYTLHVCSHMRLVAYGRKHAAGGEVGWYHISPDGTLENFSQPCQASIHRFEMEWPDDCTNLNHMLVGDRTASGLTSLDPTPSNKALYQLDVADSGR